MVQIVTKVPNKKNSLIHPSRTYDEIVHYLDTNWNETTSLLAISQLDESFGLLSKKLNIAIVSGTSGKSTTIHYACKLFQEEGLSIGAFYTPHIKLYNERFTLNNEFISNQIFANLANQVIQVAQDKKIAATTKDILTMMSLIFFYENNVDLVILENDGTYALDPVMYCNPKIVAITRVVPDLTHNDTHTAIAHIMTMVNPTTHFVSADQNKLNLQIMHKLVENKGGLWSMPTRKLAPLQYPFEQLHGRCAALAEKISHLFIDNFLHKNNNDVIVESLLNKPKGLRGRPTLEAKKAAELKPKRTIEQFWNQTTTTLQSRFELIETKKSTILLDNANNLDSLSNLFLGVRLLAYKHNYKEISLIIACHENLFTDEDFIKQARYFFKKASGSIAFCPTKQITSSPTKQVSWDIQRITNAAKTAKIKAKAYQNFTEAFNAIKAAHDNRDCLIVITGSQSIISEYNNYQETVVESHVEAIETMIE